MFWGSFLFGRSIVSNIKQVAYYSVNTGVVRVYGACQFQEIKKTSDYRNRGLGFGG